MKAVVLHEIGDLRYEEVEKPENSDGNVIVKMKAVGICGSDIPRSYENGAHKMPLIIGHEFSGQVEQVGSGVDEQWIGKRVGIFPLIPCRKCQSCLSKKYEMCSNYDYIGSRSNGGFAEYVSVPEWNLIELPDNVSFEQAAMLEPMCVAVHSMRRLSLDDVKSVAVCGLGTIGQFLVMFLLECGIENIYVIGNKKSQREAVLSMGLPEENYCDAKTMNAQEFLLDKTNGIGVDAYYDCVGKNETVALALDVVAPAGQICWLGNPFSDMNFARDSYWKILRRQLRITGTWNSSFYGSDDPDSAKDDWHYVLNALASGKIEPQKFITHKYELKDIIKGFEIMRDKTEDYMKIIAVGDRLFL